MTVDTWKAALKQALNDQIVSRGERQALSGVLSGIERTSQSNALLRDALFELARDQITDGAGRKVLDWMEDLVQLLMAQPVETREAFPPEVWFSPGSTPAQRIVRQISSARQRVDVCVFTITDDRLSEALLQAHQRKVAVRIITDNEKAYDLGSDIPRLQDAGIPVKVDETPYHMHHKFAIFDQAILLTGSYNWTRGAAENNEENFLITAEPRLLKPFAQQFEELWDKLK